MASASYIAELLKERDDALEKIGGCGDGGCVIHRRPGQHTNGGCRCVRNRAHWEINQVIRIHNRFAEKVRAAIKSEL